MCITLIRIGATEMTDDVKIDYNALAEEAFAMSKLIVATLKELRAFKKKVNNVFDFHDELRQNKTAIKQIDQDFSCILKDIAALYFELKDKE